MIKIIRKKTIDDALAPIAGSHNVRIELNVDETAYQIDYHALMPGLYLTCAEIDAKAPLSQNLIGKGQLSFQFCLDLDVSLVNHAGTQYELKPGILAVFFRPKGERFHSLVNKGHSLIFTLHVDPEFFTNNNVGFTTDSLPKNLAKIVNTPEEHNHFYWCTIPMTIAMFQLHSHILNCEWPESLKTPYFNAKFLELLCEALSALAEKNNKGTQSALLNRDVKALKKAQLIIEENYTADLSISQLAVKVGMSERKFKKTFKVFYGIPPFEYMQRLRMEQGKKLLKEGRFNITEIAYSLGYEHSCNFTTAFKRYTGVSPSFFKKNKPIHCE